MKNNTDYRKIWQISLWSTGMLLLLTLAVIWYRVVAFNLETASTNGAETDATVRFEDYEVNDSTDTWETIIRLSEDDEDTIVCTGATCAGSIVNTNDYDIKDWTLKLTMSGECYLSGFWCGSIEVHQFRSGEELINLVESQASDITGMNIDRNKYSDSMMIHMLPGDYLIYIPAVTANEDLVEAGKSVGIGFIIYYQDALDLSNWNLEYKNDMKMSDLFATKLVLLLMLVWTGALIIYICLESMTQKMQREMNKRIKNVSIMTDLYIEAYMINVDEDTGCLIKGKETERILDLTGGDVQNKLKTILSDRCEDTCNNGLLEFLDLSTVSERMNGSSSISFEYVDKIIGWCAIRLFKADDGQADNQIVLTIQDINEEKKKLRAIEERMNLAEYKQNVSGSFIETVSFALNDISDKIREDGKTILSETDPEKIKKLTERMIMNTRHMNLIQNTMLDLYEIECKRMKLNLTDYNIREMVEELRRIVTPYSEGKDYEFKIEVDDSIPEILKGDSRRLEQILVILLFSSVMMTEKGFVKFSLFGKRYDDVEELIFTVRDSAKGFTQEQLKEIHNFLEGSKAENYDNASLVYLKIINGILLYMGSELKIVSVENEGSDFYFTVKQGIVL